MESKKRKKQLKWLKFIKLLNNFAIIIVSLFLIFGFLWLKVNSKKEREHFETKRHLISVSQNDSVPKSFEIKSNLAIEITSSLDSLDFDSYAYAYATIFDNHYKVYKLGDYYYCAIYKGKDTIMIDVIDSARIYVMNRRYVDTYTDELNDYLGGGFI